MKSLLLAMLVGLLMIGCGEEAQKEAVQEERRLAAIRAEEELKRQEEERKLAAIRAEEERRLAAIRAEEERKQEAQREELRIRDTKAAYAKLGDRFTISELGLEILWVKPGAFMMGSPKSEADREDDETPHQVTLTKGFYLGKHEVAQAQWEWVMGSAPSEFKGADRPVEMVSRSEAVKFCEKLTEMEKRAGRVPDGMAYQLPTEAQWEYACRAGTTAVYSWGDSISPSNANYDENIGETTPVGKYPANPWGFHDMHGNVDEWCVDWHGTYPSGSVTHPEGPASGSRRVLRGGSWEDDGSYLRSAYRNYDDPTHRHDFIGFRVGLRASK